MASSEREKFDNPVVEWVDSRLPIFTILNKEYGVFPTPRNFNYFWNFGAILMVVLVIMILSGLFLAMNYAANTELAFDSVERIMRDVNGGWLIRYIHMNGASFFFIAVYIHMWRGMYYGSYKQPREMLWILGVVIFLLMMATAFMGYVLPWGQMSFWGATVITNLFSAFPLVGEHIVTWLWGGFAVDNPTLNRFFALHFLLPFVIFAVVILHVWALHVTGSNNPLGIEPKKKADTVPFHPYYTMKDTFGMLVLFFIPFSLFVFFAPDSLGHPDNYIEANPLVTPAHIVPEWYFLPFYAILRAITFDTNLSLLIGLVGAVYVLVMNVWYMDKPKNCPLAKAVGIPVLKDVPMGVLEKLMGLVAVLFLTIGSLIAFAPDLAATKMIMGLDVLGDVLGLKIVEAKLGGVLAMFGAIAMLVLLPFLDRHPVRSARFRPLYKIAFLLFTVNFLFLGYLGGSPADGGLFGIPFSALGLLSTALYFGFFLVVIPGLNKVEIVRELPKSITDAVLSK